LDQLICTRASTGSSAWITVSNLAFIQVNPLESRVSLQQNDRKAQLCLILATCIPKAQWEHDPSLAMRLLHKRVTDHRPMNRVMRRSPTRRTPRRRSLPDRKDPGTTSRNTPGESD
jgi:hypothetical protein